MPSIPVDSRGWLWLIWRLTRPSDFSPPGLGMRFQDVIDLTPMQAHFLLQDEDSIDAMSRRQYAARVNGRGLTVGSVVESIREYYRRLRRRYAGTDDEARAAEERELTAAMAATAKPEDATSADLTWRERYKQQKAEERRRRAEEQQQHGNQKSARNRVRRHRGP